jgi:hypothetical protein
MLAKAFDCVVRVAISNMPVVRPRCTALAAAILLDVVKSPIVASSETTRFSKSAG